jgi:hypothetical protein
MQFIQFYINVVKCVIDIWYPEMFPDLDSMPTPKVPVSGTLLREFKK